MNRDKKQHPANTDISAESTEAEREAEIEKLYLCRSKLTVEEAARLYSIYRRIVDEHHKLVWNYLRKRVRSNDDVEELFQEVFIALYQHILENGFPEDLSQKIHSICRGKVSNYRDAQNNAPSVEGLSSSGSKPRSALTIAADLDRAMDLRALARHLLPQLSPENQQVAQKVFLDDLSHREAAAAMGLTMGQLKARVAAAKDALYVLAAQVLPLSQRGLA